MVYLHINKFVQINGIKIWKKLWTKSISFWQNWTTKAQSHLAVSKKTKHAQWTWAELGLRGWTKTVVRLQPSSCFDDVIRRRQNCGKSIPVSRQQNCGKNILVSRQQNCGKSILFLTNFIFLYLINGSKTTFNYAKAT